MFQRVKRGRRMSSRPPSKSLAAEGVKRFARSVRSAGRSPSCKYAGGIGVEFGMRSGSSSRAPSGLPLRRGVRL